MKMPNKIKRLKARGRPTFVKEEVWWGGTIPLYGLKNGEVVVLCQWPTPGSSQWVPKRFVQLFWP